MSEETLVKIGGLANIKGMIDLALDDIDIIRHVLYGGVDGT